LRHNVASPAQASIPQYQSWGDTPQPKRIKGPVVGPLCPTKCGPGRKHGPLQILETQLHACTVSLFTFLPAVPLDVLELLTFNKITPLTLSFTIIAVSFIFAACLLLYYLHTTKEFSSSCMFPATTTLQLTCT